MSMCEVALCPSNLLTKSKSPLFDILSAWFKSPVTAICECSPILVSNIFISNYMVCYSIYVYLMIAFSTTS